MKKSALLALLFCIGGGTAFSLPESKNFQHVRKAEEAATPAQAKLIERMCRALEVEEPVSNYEKVRIGSSHDGGYVIIKGFDYDALYSYGIADDISFEEGFSELHQAPCYLYDHTISQMPATRKARLKWFKEGISNQSLEGLDTLENQVAKNGDENKQNLFLKMDVEGAEWHSLLVTPDKVLRQFKQISIEFHGLSDPEGWGVDLLTKVQLLEKLHREFAPVHVHGNNNSPFFHSQNYCMPDVLEVTYLRRSEELFKPSTVRYPIQELDRPNNIENPEIILDAYPFAPSL